LNAMRRPPEPEVALASSLRLSQTPTAVGTLMAIDGTVGVSGPRMAIDWLNASMDGAPADSTSSRR